ncbi:UDP-N-acetylglucosamine 3-dehydrogenase [Methanococcoides sp. NM1]|uniref:UDP-N-acetylglucosamine 3-dehydrogenase n=1 Tax=Methanococcoides sp. NM1 TaxID=1201013 RepID=UPI001082B04A|nr:UDP-N-acetylglucosamine 3-dehydrogenase [Methanococcoides sp. NM1]
MTRVGVIGVGAMGQHHVRIYKEMEGVELVGISDVDRDRVEELAAKYDVKAYTDYEELLKENLDAVSIVVPTTLHKKVSLDAINSNANVLVEKPIADTLENADIMIEAAEKAGVILMVGQIERFNPATTKMKEIIDSGLLGKIVSISTKRVGPYNPRIRDVGIILDLGVHDIDAISYMYGSNVTEVYAIAGKDIHSKEDHASIMLRFDDEQAGVVNINWLTPHKVRKMEVIGVHGVGYLDYIDQTVTIHDAKWIRNAKVEKAEPLQKELEHFINCIEKGDTPLESGIDGKHALKVALSAIGSYNRDGIIRID